MRPSRHALAGLFAAAAMTHALPAFAEEHTGPAWVEVKRGDTLSGLAARHKVSIDELRAWNPGRIGTGLVIRAGDRLRVVPVEAPAEAPPDSRPTQPARNTWRDHIAVRRGDTLGGIARKHRVELADLLRWNGLRETSPIRAGDRLVIERPGPKPKAASIGRATGGRLEHGVWLDKGPGYRLRFPKNAYGTEQVVETLRRCAKRVHDRFEGTADILYGDLSRPGGGRFPPHESHQSGRDADVGYYLAGNIQNATMHVVRADAVDYAKTWALLRCYLRTGAVVRAYMDRRIQKAMAEHLAKTAQVSPAILARLFETVGGPNALIRHAPKHDTHVHVRFACGDGDRDCELEPGEKAWHSNL
jgi:murein endopeptidase